MAVNSTHPLYKANLPAWSRARDVLAGEDAMKAAGDKYLPRLDSQSDVEYGAYTARASFFGATALTLEGYLDLIFRRAPMSSLPNPERLRGFVEDCDRWGTSFVRYARRVVSETLSVGRAGSLVLQDPPSPKTGQPIVWCGVHQFYSSNSQLGLVGLAATGAFLWCKVALAVFEWRHAQHGVMPAGYLPSSIAAQANPLHNEHTTEIDHIQNAFEASLAKDRPLMSLFASFRRRLTTHEPSPGSSGARGPPSVTSKSA